MAPSLTQVSFGVFFFFLGSPSFDSVPLLPLHFRQAARGKTVAQVALNFALTEGGGCAIVGARGRGQAEENLGACGWALEDGELWALAEAARKAGDGELSRGARGLKGVQRASGQSRNLSCFQEGGCLDANLAFLFKSWLCLRFVLFFFSFFFFGGGWVTRLWANNGVRRARFLIGRRIGGVHRYGGGRLDCRPVWAGPLLAVGSGLLIYVRGLFGLDSTSPKLFLSA